MRKTIQRRVIFLKNLQRAALILLALLMAFSSLTACRKNAVIEDCELDTKDAFWHAENVTVRNCTVKGEYLAWYSKDLTLINCRIIGTQPLCYCKGLKLIDCEMIDTDLAFERSEVEATVTTPIVSIKNAYAGYIKAPAAELIRDDENANCVIELG